MESVFVVTASRTSDGRAVYLRPDRRWSETLGEAQWVADRDAQASAMSWAGTQQYDVCDPYVLPVFMAESGLIASSTRERIRAAGPRWIAERFGYEV